MKRQVPGLADATRDSRPDVPDGIFLVRVDGAQFRWHAQKPFYVLRLSILSPTFLPIGPSSAVCTAPRRRCGNSAGSFAIFSMTPKCWHTSRSTKKSLPGLRGVVKISHTMVNGISLINLDGFAPASQWEELSASPVPAASRSQAEEGRR